MGKGKNLQIPKLIINKVSKSKWLFQMTRGRNNLSTNCIIIQFSFMCENKIRMFLRYVGLQKTSYTQKTGKFFEDRQYLSYLSLHHQ